MGGHICSTRGGRANLRPVNIFLGFFFLPDGNKACVYLTEGIHWPFGTNQYKLTWTGLCFEHNIRCNTGRTLRKPSIYRASTLKLSSQRLYAHHIYTVDIVKYTFRTCTETSLQFTCSPWTVMAHAWLSIAADGSPCKDALRWGLSRSVSHWSRMHGGKAHFPSYSEVKYFWIHAWFVVGILRMFLFFW